MLLNLLIRWEYMQLEKKDIEHIAKLSRLDLSEAEIEKYGGQLSAVLGYIEQLSEVNTDGVEPTAQVSGLVNGWREDEIKVWENNERLATLNEAPKFEDDYVVVKKVL